MLLLLTFAVMVSSNSAVAPDPSLLRFLTELVINVLHWHWVVIIEEGHEELNPVLVEHFIQKNVSITILTSRVETAIRQLLYRYSYIPVLLLFSPRVENRNFFLNTCRIKWVVLVSDSTYAVLRESTRYLHRLQVVFAIRGADDAFALHVPAEKASELFKINSWHPNKGFENLLAFRQCSTQPIKHMRIAMEKHFPFYRPGNSTYPPQGADINLLDSLSVALKFTYDVTNPPDGSWGSRNGTEWNGMIGMLLRNEADAALSGMTMSYERQREVPFSVPYAFDRVTYVTRKPARRLKTWAIFWPYTLDVWIALATLIVIIAWLLTWLQTRLKGRRRRRRLRFSDSLMFIFQSILNQGYYNAREPRCRVLMSFWWAFCITVIAGYNGSLMSFMAHPGLSPSLDTVSELVEAVERDEISVGTIENSADYDLFKNSEEPDLRVILESMESDPSNLVHHDTDGLRETLRRSYAYIGGWVTVQADVWDPKLFLFSRASFMQYGYAIAFAPGFDYVDEFNRRILHLRESGLIQKWILEIIERSQHRGNVDEDSVEQDKDDSEAPDQSSLGIDDVQGAFTVLVIGLILGVACCIVENYIVWYSKSPSESV